MSIRLAAAAAFYLASCAPVLAGEGQGPHDLQSPAPILLIGATDTPMPAAAHSLRIMQPWLRATPGGASVAGGYLAITNSGTRPDRLLSFSTPAARRGEIHEMATLNGVMTMRPLADGIAIGAGETVTLKPGGLHLMLMDLKSPIMQGDAIPATLVFEQAGPIDIMLKAEPIGARSPSGDAHGGHDHGD